MSVHNVISELEQTPSTETLNLPGSIAIGGTTNITGAIVGGAAASITGLVTATGGLAVGTAEGITTGIKNIVRFSGASVAVPSITDPDINSVAVDVSSLALGIAFGDVVLGVGFGSALPTNCRFQGAYVSAADEVTLVFGSLGGNVTGANRAVEILIADIT